MAAYKPAEAVTAQSERTVREPVAATRNELRFGHIFVLAADVVEVEVKVRDGWQRLLQQDAHHQVAHSAPACSIHFVRQCWDCWLLQANIQRLTGSIGHEMIADRTSPARTDRHLARTGGAFPRLVAVCQTCPFCCWQACPGQHAADTRVVTQHNYALDSNLASAVLRPGQCVPWQTLWTMQSDAVDTGAQLQVRAREQCWALWETAKTHSQPALSLLRQHMCQY